MQPERWRRIEALFHEAQRHPPDARDAFLSAACAGDESLLSEVQSLLHDPSRSHLLATADLGRSRVLAPSGPHPPAGQRLGKFDLLEVIGSGGMGDVYRARDRQLGRDVAIKVLPPSVASNPDRLARFDREGRILAALNHPNIATIHGTETTGDQPPAHAIVMELLDGETLAQRLRRVRLRVPEALQLARQVVRALDAAHRKGIVHRDLKPSNINVTASGVVKVLDFGLATVTPTQPAAEAASGSETPTVTVGRTFEGLIVGTAAYMSPEQARGLPVDKQTDIWAFGCVLYEMLAGKPTFGRATISETIAAVIERDPDWNALPEATPPSIRRLLARCLAKDPDQRLHDIGDVGLQIDDALSAAPAQPHVAAARSPMRLLAIASAAAAIVASAAFLAWRMAGPGEPRNPLANANAYRLTSFPESELDAAISPDGRFVVFISNREGPYDAWVTQVGAGGAATNLTKGTIPYILNDRVHNVGFTSDNQVTLVSEPRDGSGRLIRTETLTLPLTGGAPRRLLDRGVEAVWSPDGTRFAYHESGPGDPLLVATTGGREPKQIFVGAAGIHSHFLTWSPDGEWIYFAHGVPPDEMDIWRVPADGGSAERMTYHHSDVAYPTFLDRHTLLYRTNAEDGSGPWLYWIDVRRPQPLRANMGVGQYLSIAAAADGSRLVATVANPTSGLWDVPITETAATEESTRPIAVPNVRAVSPRYASGAIWYLSSDASAQSLWRLADGAASEVWKPGPGGLPAPPVLSPAGNRIAFLGRVDGKRQLYLMNADGTDVQPLAESLDVRDAPAWSPDGRWLAVATGDRLVKIGADASHQAVVLVAGPARIPVWSPDGRFILYSESAQGGPDYPVKAVTPDGTPFPLPPVTVRRSGDRYRVMPDGRRVVFMVGDYGRQQFWVIDIESGQRRQLTNFRPGFTIQGFDISPDGSRILYDRIATNSDVVLIDRSN